MERFQDEVLTVEPDIRLHLAAYDPGAEYFIDKEGECWFGKCAGHEEFCGSPTDKRYKGERTYVAVIETGIYKAHTDFNNDDGSTQYSLIGIEDSPGIDYDCANGIEDKDPEEERGTNYYGHGTKVIGVLNARAGNEGIAVIAFKAKVLPFADSCQWFLHITGTTTQESIRRRGTL